MGLFKDAFSWALGLSDKKIDAIDMDELRIKTRKLDRLRVSWERRIQSCNKEYRNLMDPEKNVGRTGIEMRLAMQRGKALASQMNTMTKSVNMICRMSGMIGQVQMLKEFYEDLKRTSPIPGGLSIKELVAQMDGMGNEMQQASDKVLELEHAMEQVDLAIGGEPTVDEQRVMQLLEELQTAQAMGNQEDVVRVKKELNEAYGLAGLGMV